MLRNDVIYASDAIVAIVAYDVIIVYVAIVVYNANVIVIDVYVKPAAIADIVVVLSAEFYVVVPLQGPPVKRQLL